MGAQTNHSATEYISRVPTRATHHATGWSVVWCVCAVCSAHANESYIRPHPQLGTAQVSVRAHVRAWVRGNVLLRRFV